MGQAHGLLSGGRSVSSFKPSASCSKVLLRLGAHGRRNPANIGGSFSGREWTFTFAS